MPGRRHIPLFIALVLLGLPIVTATAQGPRRPPPAASGRGRAVLEGRYDEIDKLTASLDPNDPDVVAVKARAAIARGRYEQAETMLRAVVPLAPTSDAALELGLLLQMLGRADARRCCSAWRCSPVAAPSRSRLRAGRARCVRSAC